MFTFAINFLLSGIIIYIACYIIPGVDVSNVPTALLVAGILALINAFIAPLLRILKLHRSFLSLGIRGIILGFVVLVTLRYSIQGFEINNWLSALIFAILLGLLNGTISRI